MHNDIIIFLLLSLTPHGYAWIPHRKDIIIIVNIITANKYNVTWCDNNY